MDLVSLLVADDEPIVRTSIRRYVLERDLPVSGVYDAANGQEAIELALKHAPDIALLDIRMPGVNGLDAAAAILKEKPDTRIVMVTAYDEFEYARAALRAGVDDYLLKPLDPEALARRGRDVLRAKMELAAAARVGADKHIHPLVAMVSRHVNAHLGDNLHLDGIARAVYASPAHCSRVFSRHAGVSISGFIAQRRLERSMELLADTYMSVTDIAAEVGFSSPAYFASWFKRLAGLSPLQYRKHGRNPPGLCPP
jgi:YesN/AraC family two-component response regulator